MDLKKMSKNDKAVSPVIGVVLMVAITVILAAAIGSSVFGQGPAKTAPQANINAKIVDGDTLVIEHMGGDTLVWTNTQIRFTLEDGTIPTYLDSSVVASTTGIIAYPTATRLDADGQFSVGDILSFDLVSTANTDLPTGQVFNLKITDKVTNQLICDKKLRS
ncbi:type IV pilin N-terminal domain-containing protein [Methanosarcina hadiensis]|uniref:type IV pilin n=1 Tax=Methanosarcina hadiensis TaxID=3078083 RepID=UPI0039775C96